MLREHEAGMKTADVCRKHGVSEGTDSKSHKRAVWKCAAVAVVGLHAMCSVMVLLLPLTGTVTEEAAKLLSEGRRWRNFHRQPKQAAGPSGNDLQRRRRERSPTVPFLTGASRASRGGRRTEHPFNCVGQKVRHVDGIALMANGVASRDLHRAGLQ